jgi:hypothetical protein
VEIPHPSQFQAHKWHFHCHEDHPAHTRGIAQFLPRMGVTNPNCNEWTVTGLPLAAENFSKTKSIHVAFNCQKLLPNWIDMITKSGTCDIMFRSKADLEA